MGGKEMVGERGGEIGEERKREGISERQSVGRRERGRGKEGGRDCRFFEGSGSWA